MNLQRFRLAYPLAIISGLVLACGTSKTQTTSHATSPGQLALSLVDEPSTDTTSTDTTSTDAPPANQERASHVYVSVKEVKVHHSASGWVTVKTFDAPYQQVDVLALQDSALDLGLVDLPEGTINQIRLVVATEGNQVVLLDGTTKDLKVPSGYQSGIKINGSWTITACTQTTLTLAVDGHKPIWYHPTGGDDLWILRPVIRVKAQVDEPVDCTTPPTSGPVACDPTAATSTCPENQVCVPNTDSTLPDPGYCAQHPGPGSVCVAGAECTTGICNPTGGCAYSGPGQACYADGDCESGSCDATNNTCNQGAIGAPCDADTDCASGLCDTANTLTCVEAPPACTVDKLPPGSTCQLNDECQSLTCTNNLCALNQAGDPCMSQDQCDSSQNLNCIIPADACAGTCTLPPVQPG